MKGRREFFCFARVTACGLEKKACRGQARDAPRAVETLVCAGRGRPRPVRFVSRLLLGRTRAVSSRRRPGPRREKGVEHGTANFRGAAQLGVLVWCFDARDELAAEGFAAPKSGGAAELHELQVCAAVTAVVPLR